MSFNHINSFIVFDGDVKWNKEQLPFKVLGWFDVLSINSITDRLGLIKSKPIKVKAQNADGFIFCAPEYNGSIPPILTNVIAWISVKTSNWRGAFNGKTALICTHSGGVGNNFKSSLRIQLNHLGVIVLPRTISKTDNLPFKPESASEILDQLIAIT